MSAHRDDDTDWARLAARLPFAPIPPHRLASLDIARAQSRDDLDDLIRYVDQARATCSDDQVFEAFVVQTMANETATRLIVTGMLAEALLRLAPGGAT